MCDNLSMDAELLTVHEAAEVLRVHDATIRRLIAEGGLEHLRVRGTIRIPVEAIEALRHPATKTEELTAA